MNSYYFLQVVLSLSCLVVTLMYPCSNTQIFYILPTQCVYVFCMDLRTNSDYFTVQFFLLVYVINSFSKTAHKAKTRARKTHFPFLATL